MPIPIKLICVVALLFVLACTHGLCLAQSTPFASSPVFLETGELAPSAFPIYPSSELPLYSNDPNSARIDDGQESQLSGLIGPSGITDDPLFTARPRTTSLPTRLINDQLNFYSPESLLLLGAGLGVGAAVANTTLDGDIQRHLQSSLHHANSDDWLESLHANKELGDGRFTLPIYAGAWALGSLLPESEFSNGSKVWGERTLRGFIVGAPPVLLLQRATGGSRPGESTTGSEWEPFRDNNGVSGHAFMGALPFITAAKMTDKIGWKVTFYAASTLAPLSRTADGAHYPSQVALGWGMAFLAATAVHSTDNPNARWRVMPTTTPNGSGMALEYRF